MVQFLAAHPRNAPSRVLRIPLGSRRGVGLSERPPLSLEPCERAASPFAPLRPRGEECPPWADSSATMASRLTTEATPRQCHEMAMAAMESLPARNAGVTMATGGPARPYPGHTRGQGCRIRGNARTAARHVVRAALACTGAAARSAQCSTKRYVRTLRRGSRARARRIQTTIPFPRRARGRVPSVPDVRHSGSWLRPCTVPGVQARFPGGVLVQGQGCLPVVQHAAHGTDRGAPD